MISAICQVYTKRGSKSGEGNSMERNKEKKENKERNRRKKIEREEEESERERGRGRKICSFVIYRCFDGQSSLGKELKFVYVTRAKL